jgi:hypothetical protein
MAHIKIPAKRNVNNLTKEIPYWRMPTGIEIVGVLKELLSITY